MYKTIKIIFGLLIILAFQSCESEKTAPIKSSSADGKINIEVSGERSSSADPYMVTIACDQFENTASVEIYASTLDSTNVKFNWLSNQECIISITHRDGEVTQVPIRVQTQ